MEKINCKNMNIIKIIITVLMYFLWPTVSSLLLNSFNIVEQNKIVYSLFLNLILLAIITKMYSKEIILCIKNIKDNFSKSIKNIFLLLALIISVQVLTNGISLIILGDNNKIISGSALFNYLENLPLIMGIMMVIYYPIVETIVFSKIFKDIINNKWMFIILSSLFFWTANIVTFGISLESMIIALSCLTSTIVINSFYYKNDNIAIIFIVKMIYNLIFILLP